MNIDKNNIKVFPSTRRAREQVDARLMTEAAMVGIINQLINTDGFIITKPVSSTTGYDANEAFEFNIHGYYFRVDKASYITAIGTPSSASDAIYGNIFIDESNDYHEIRGEDTSGQYSGLTITSGSPSPEPNDAFIKRYYLKLFEPVGTGSSMTWGVANESRIKFEDVSTDIDIDGGIILA